LSLEKCGAAISVANEVFDLHELDRERIRSGAGGTARRTGVQGGRSRNAAADGLVHSWWSDAGT